MLAFGQTEAATSTDQTASVPPMLGIHWAKGAEPLLPARRSPNMTYHGGVIMPTANVTAIYWGPSWTSPGDKISGMTSWYQGFSNSNYAKTSDEYTGSNGQVGPTSSYAGQYIDTGAAGNGNNTSAILAEVCKEITSPDPSGNGYYPVYVDKTRGSNGYCAYHSVGTCHGIRVQFGFFFKLDGDAGCDPGDTSGLHSQGLAAIANVSGHELSEARTDPANPGRMVRLQWPGERRQVRMDLQRAAGDVLQRHQVEDPGRVVECGLHRRHRLPQQQRTERLPRRSLKKRRMRRSIFRG